ELLLEDVAERAAQAREDTGALGLLAALAHVRAAEAVVDQAHRRREGRGAHRLHQTAHALGQAATNGQTEDLLTQLGDAGHLSSAAGDDRPRGQEILATEAYDLGLHEREDLLDARLDDVPAERVARQNT